jgi:hypothetical protein
MNMMPREVNDGLFPDARSEADAGLVRCDLVDAVHVWSVAFFNLYRRDPRVDEAATAFGVTPEFLAHAVDDFASVVFWADPAAPGCGPGDRKLCHDEA